MTVNEKIEKLESRLAALENIVYKRKPPEDSVKDVLVGLDTAVVKKLEVKQVDGEVRIHTREWLGRNTWRMVNQQLQQQGFKWESKGKESYWRR